MKDIQSKLDKYSTNYIPGEKRSPEYQRKLNQELALRRRKQIAKNMKYEAKYLLINEAQVEQVNYLISIFNDKFKLLHKRASEETIILAFFFYVLRLSDSQINIENYRISTKYNLTYQVFSLILTRMLNYFMENSPIRPYSTEAYDHEILYETRGRIP